MAWSRKDSGNLTVIRWTEYSYQANQNFDALKPGDQTIDVFSVTINIGGTAVTLDLTFHITGANDLPLVVNPIPNQIINEDVGWIFTIPANTFSDPERSSLTFAASLAGGAPLPNWLTFNPVTGTFSGTPPLNANGSVPLEVVASDGTSSVANLFTLNVVPVNDAPAVANAIADQNATQGSAFSFQFAANTFNDVDVGDTLTYTATLDTNAPLPVWLSFDAATRTFSGTPQAGESARSR